jgi:hypothetical protein
MYIDKVQVFNGETKHKSPCIVLHLSQARPEKPTDAEMVSEVVRMEDVQVQVVRTHVLRAKL